MSDETEQPAAESFDYGSLAPADAAFLKQMALGLRVSLRRTVKEILEAGDLLLKARRRLGKKWRPWLRHEAQFPPRSASRLIATAKVFAKVEPQVLDRFTPTALYTLAEPSVPQSIREYCVEFAEDNPREFVTAGMVIAWLDSYRDAPKLSAREVNKLATKDQVAAPKVNPDEIHAAQNWLLLDKLLGAGGSLHLTASSDAEMQDRTIMGVFVTETGERRVASHIGALGTASILEHVLLKLTGERREKACPRCKAMKALDEFSVRADRSDGRNGYCLACERQRVRDYERKKRAKERAEREAGREAA